MTVDSRCPRPDKLAFDTEEEAADRYKSLLLSDLTMRVYRCKCRKWHAGRREENVEANGLANVPMIRTGLNMVDDEPAPRARRRPAEVHRAGAVTTTQMNQELWKDALRRADGDITRIERISETRVVVHNNGNWRKRRKVS